MKLLLTGATGTIGKAVLPLALSELYTEIILFSRDELKQSELERELRGHEHFWKLQFWLGDVRDKDRVEEVMRGTTHVIHAAALKRIEKCELDPSEAVKTNVIGTHNIVQAALKSNVSSVCVVSTDKAYNPKCSYGATKMLAERIALSANTGLCRFSVVRQGNIFKSRGSVVEVWQKLKDQGLSPVPMSAPDATRFFVTSENASSFIMNALKTKRGLVYPKNLKAYQLSDLAKAMEVETRTIGLAPFEKLHEEMDNTYGSFIAPLMTVEELREALYDRSTQERPA